MADWQNSEKIMVQSMVIVEGSSKTMVQSIVQILMQWIMVQRMMTFVLGCTMVCTMVRQSALSSTIMVLEWLIEHDHIFIMVPNILKLKRKKDEIQLKMRVQVILTCVD